ncbi:MAG: Rieske (2Fe-2S) protein [Jiangellaceae bacterium]
MAELDRRTILRVGALTGVIGTAGPLLAACGGGDDGAATGGGATGGRATTGDGGPTDQPTETPAPSGTGDAPPSNGLASTSDIPVGGGTVFADADVVITQPTAGEFKAFSAVCTHQGCTVGEVTQGSIICPCHGSVYSIEDGSVQGGPAPAPLAEKALVVEGDQLVLG